MSSKSPDNQNTTEFTLANNRAMLQAKVMQFTAPRKRKWLSGKTGSNSARKLKNEIAEIMGKMAQSYPREPRTSWDEVCKVVKQKEEEWIAHEKFIKDKDKVTVAKLINPESDKEINLYALFNQCKTIALQAYSQEEGYSKEDSRLLVDLSIASLSCRDPDHNVFQRMRAFLMATKDSKQLRAKELDRIALDLPSFVEIRPAKKETLFTKDYISAENIEALYDRFLSAIHQKSLVVGEKPNESIEERFEHHAPMGERERAYLPDRTAKNLIRVGNLKKLNALIIQYGQEGSDDKFAIASALRDSMQGRLPLHKAVAVSLQHPGAMGSGKLATVFADEMSRVYRPEGALIKLEQAKAYVGNLEDRGDVVANFNRLEDWLITGRLSSVTGAELAVELDNIAANCSKEEFEKVAPCLDPLLKYVEKIAKRKAELIELKTHYEGVNDADHQKKLKIVEAAAKCLDLPTIEHFQAYKEAKRQNPGAYNPDALIKGKLAKCIEKIDNLFAASPVNLINEIAIEPSIEERPVVEDIQADDEESLGSNGQEELEGQASEALEPKQQFEQLCQNLEGDLASFWRYSENNDLSEQDKEHASKWLEYATNQLERFQAEATTPGGASLPRINQSLQEVLDNSKTSLDYLASAQQRASNEASVDENNGQDEEHGQAPTPPMTSNG